jgi:hypothetical protein
MAIAAAVGGVFVIALIAFLVVRHRKNRTRRTGHHDPLELSPSTLQLISDGNDELNLLRRLPPRSNASAAGEGQRRPHTMGFLTESELSSVTPSAARYGVGVGASILGNAGDLGWQQAGYHDHMQPESSYSAPTSPRDLEWKRAGYADHLSGPAYSTAAPGAGQDPTYAAPTYDVPTFQTDTDSMGYQRPVVNSAYQGVSRVRPQEHTYALTSDPSALLPGDTETDDVTGARHEAVDTAGYQVPQTDPSYAAAREISGGGDFYAIALSNESRRHAPPAATVRVPPATAPRPPTAAAVAAALAAVGVAPANSDFGSMQPVRPAQQVPGQASASPQGSALSVPHALPPAPHSMPNAGSSGAYASLASDPGAVTTSRPGHTYEYSTVPERAAGQDVYEMATRDHEQFVRTL